MSPIKTKELPLKKSWLNGKANMSYPDQLLYGPVHQFAQPLLKFWTEEEARTCWKEFEAILNEYTKKQGKKNYITSPLTIIEKFLFMLEGLKSYQSFKIKWDALFQKINSLKALHPKKQNVFIINTVHPKYIIGALYILHHASKGNIAEVMSAHAFLSDHQRQEIKISLAEEEGVSKSKSRTAREKRRGIKSLLRETLEECPDINYLSAWNRILKMPANRKNHYRISSMEPSTKLIIRENGRHITILNFKNTFYKVRGELKNKMP